MSHANAQKQNDLYEDVLYRYAQGHLVSPLAVVINAHMESHPKAAHFVAGLEDIGGYFLENTEPDCPVSDHLREATLSRIGSGEAVSPSRQNKTLAKIEGLEDIPKALFAYIARSHKALSWRHLTEEIEFMCISDAPEGQTDAFFLRVKPNAVFPKHGHSSTEITFVLHGAVHDQDVRIRKGDIKICNETDEHAPKACPEAGCIALCVYEDPISMDFFEGLFN